MCLRFLRTTNSTYAYLTINLLNVTDQTGQEVDLDRSNAGVGGADYEPSTGGGGYIVLAGGLTYAFCALLL